MDLFSTRAGRLIAGALALLLLAGAGYATIEGVSFLGNLEDTLSRLGAALASPASPSEGEGATPEPTDEPAEAPTEEEPERVTPEATEGASEETTQPASPIPTPTPIPEDFVVLYPGEGDTVVIDANHPEIQVRLLSREAELKGVRVELLIYQDKAGTPLSPALTSVAVAEGLTLTTTQPVNALLTFANLPPSGEYGGWLVATATNGRTLSRRVNILVSNPTAGEVMLLYPNPTGSDALVISAEHPAAQIRLVNTGIVTTSARVRLTVHQPKEGTPLSPGPVGTTEASIAVLPPNEPTNVTISFQPETLPPSGEYEGWLVIETEDAEPLTQKVTLQISRPAFSIQHRLTGKAEGERAILLTGIRWLPLAPRSITWEPYRMRFWEKDRQEVSFEFLPTELVDGSTGQVGYLNVAPVSSPIEGVTEVDLSIEGVRYPGLYEGLLVVRTAEGWAIEAIHVTARVCDFYIWPFLAIVIGALSIGLLLRAGLRDTKSSIPFQRYLLAVARQRLDAACAASPPTRVCKDIGQKLDQVEMALAFGDVDQARVWLAEAMEAIHNLKTAASHMAAFKAKLEESEAEGEGDLEDVRRKYEAAEIYFQAGDWASLETVLKEAEVALDRSTLMVELDLDRTARLLQQEVGIPHIRGRVTDPSGGERVLEDGGVLYTDETVEFTVSPTDDGVFEWEVWWVRRFYPDKVMARSKEPTSTFTPTFEWAPVHRYPRVCKVTARSDGGLPPFMLSFEIRHPFRIWLPDTVRAGQRVALRLLPERAGERPPKGYRWYVDGVPVDSPHLFKKPGEYQITARAKGRLLAATVVRVHRSLVEIAAKRYKRQACIAILAWAAVAGVIGLIYIAERVPTFGRSWQDYLLALAWGLGVSASVTPKEGVVDAIKKAVGIQPPAKETVPLLKGKTKAEAQRLIAGKFIPKWEPKEAKEDWIVAEQRPSAGTAAKKGTEITIVLQQPKSRPALSITKVNPTTGKRDEKEVKVTITGSGFAQGATARLERKDVQPIPAKTVRILDAGKMECVFDLKGRPTGEWDVVVAIGDKSARKEKGFRIT